MAPRLYKVTDPSRSKRSLVSGDNLEELISEACTNLNIASDSSCRFVLEEDGTFIQKINILESLAEFYPNVPLLLMVVYKDAPWKPISEIVSPVASTSSATDSRQSVESNSPINIREENIDLNPAPSTSRLSALPWDSIVPKKLKDIETNPISYILEFIRNAAEYMTDVLQDDTFKTAGRIAELMVAKFPRVFGFSVSNDNERPFEILVGVKSLRKRIYDRVKKTQQSGKQSRPADSDGEENDNTTNAQLERYGKDQDIYGCKAFQPPLPTNETNETQNIIKNSLLLSISNPEMQLSVEEESRFLNLTYATQRININKREELKLTLSDLLQNHWPHLRQENHFLAHAEILFGKDCKSIWLENVRNKAPAIYEHFRDYCAKYRNSTVKPKVVQKLEPVQRELRNASLTLESSFPKTVGFVSLLAAFFDEEPIYKLIDIDASDDEVKEMADETRPILIIKALTFFDESAQCFIAIDKTILLRTSDVLQGILLLVLSYYVYGYNYPAKKSSTFEFIQRMLIDINPPTKGSKRQRKNKHQRLNEEDSRSIKLINKILKHMKHSV